MLKALEPWLQLRRFQRLDPAERACVFYSEGASYWLYLRPVLESLVGELGQRVCYVTSDPGDPLLSSPLPGMRAFSVGAGMARVVFFATLQSRVAVLTLPDLGLFQIKRSRFPVHYVYLHHSMVSTHMIYRRGAFDHFDSILCVGPHHVAETREWEKLQGLAPKQLFEHGYGPLDQLLGERSTLASFPGGSSPPRVLVAPSWGPGGLLETAGRPLVTALLGSGCQVTLRPHPRTERLAGAAMDELRTTFSDHPRLRWDREPGSKASFLDADLMVSDWSGAALEFAFGLERPVLFVDVERKVNNPDYERLEAVPLEVSVRETIGTVLSPDRLQDVPAAVEGLLRNRNAVAERIREARSRWVFNLGSSGRTGAEVVQRLLAGARG
jgi:YidC/Oxa1 family membrane protein insertase